MPVGQSYTVIIEQKGDLSTQQQIYLQIYQKIKSTAPSNPPNPVTSPIGKSNQIRAKIWLDLIVDNCGERHAGRAVEELQLGAEKPHQSVQVYSAEYC